MGILLYIVVLTLGIGTESTVYVPSTCSLFKYAVNPYNLTGLHLPFVPLATLKPPAAHSLSHLLTIRPSLESLQRGQLQKKFLYSQGFTLPPINLPALYAYASHAIITSVAKTLPKNRPVQSSCVFDIDTTSHSTLDFLRAMYRRGSYKACILCNGPESGNATCDKFTFCPSTSHCYRGYNRDHTATVNTKVTFNPPYAASYGCCDSKDPHCHHTTYAVKDASNSKITRANYTISTCSSFLCNADPALITRKSTLIHRLIDGHWSSWTTWSSCSHTCGFSTRRRTRTCNNPSPFHGGRSCSGLASTTAVCHVAACPVAGGWTRWSSWSSCSRTCGNGTHTRTRSCTNPHPSHGGHTCSGLSTSSATCTNSQCPVDGHWTTWHSWSSCSKTCGRGVMSRSRTCTNPAPAYKGKACSGDASITSTCELRQCPVDGHWASWHPWSSCSQTCGRGEKFRSRTCTNPTPNNGGKPCSGYPTVKTACELRPCPVDGGWSEWHAWSACSVSCTAGIKTRTRACDNPSASNGGKHCHGSPTGKLACDNGKCPVWSSWYYGRCSVTCGNGTTSRFRHCSSGKDGDCHGAPTEDVACQDRPCPIAGQWAAWQHWGACTQSCGEGKHVRNRTCSNPAPGYGGAACTGSADETEVCNTQQCPVAGRWTKWAHWSSCSRTCGNGTHTRHRTCTNPPPSHGGHTCSGSSSSSETCINTLCPVDGHWATWQAWTSCSQTCGRGVMSRSRTCTSPAPANGGKSCSGDAAMASTCELRHCPVDGGWSEWHTWSACSVSCTAGIKTRTRACDNPPASSGGKQCHGSLTEKLACDNGVCPVWSSWYYGRCSVTCGNGTTSRLRHCSSGKDGDCHGAPTEDVSCQDRPCPIDGQWNAWQQWSACTQSCGEGKHVRNRMCSNPAPAYGGAACTGSADETEVCNTQQCPHWLDYHEVGTCSVSCGEGVIQLERKCSTGNRADCTGSPYNEKPCSMPSC